VDVRSYCVKQPEYREGPEALGEFKALATAILQAPPKKKKRQTKKSASLRKAGGPHLLLAKYVPQIGWVARSFWVARSLRMSQNFPGATSRTPAD
jgi:hypothetical protein